MPNNLADDLAFTRCLPALPLQAPERVLVVDDDEFELTLLCDRLRARGFDVTAAANGQAALSLLLDRPYAVLLTDWRMPEMDGIELTRRARELGMDDLYIVMLTALEDARDLERAYAAGVDDYLTKKVSDAEVQMRLFAALAAVEVRRQLRQSQADLAALRSEQARQQVTPSPVQTIDIGSTTQVLALQLAPSSRILLVDDDELVLEVLSGRIEAAGHKVTCVTSGEAALAALREQFMPIVILDRSMPGMDGLELCQRIRAGSWPGYVYLVLLTAADSEQEILAGLSSGADDYLSKRISDAHLLAKLTVANRVLSLEQSLRTALGERARVAMTDPLTGLNNRRYLVRQLARELSRTLGEGRGLSVLMVDIDHFKQINDEFGHAIGDAALQLVASRINYSLRHQLDWCARLGGEEFAIVLPDTGLTAAIIIAERLRELMAQRPFNLCGQSRPITVSVGVGSLQSDKEREKATVESLLAQADRCLYESKRAGRNRVSAPSDQKT